MNDKAKDKIQEIIEGSGNNFHASVIKFLREKEWTVLISPYYNYYATDKAREIDEIVEHDIRKTIEFPDIIKKESLKTIAIKKFSGKYSGYPLKVVYEKREEKLFVITTYPLKKKLWR